MSYPDGYSDPYDKTHYGSAFDTNSSTKDLPPPPSYESLSPQVIVSQTQYTSPVPFGVTDAPFCTAPYGDSMTLTNQPQPTNEQQVFSQSSSLPSIALTDPGSSEHPVQMKCPSCEANITTIISPADMGFMESICCCIFSCFMDYPTEFIHSCPCCHYICGTYIPPRQNTRIHRTITHTHRRRRTNNFLKQQRQRRQKNQQKRRRQNQRRRQRRRRR